MSQSQYIATYIIKYGTYIENIFTLENYAKNSNYS